MHGDVALCTPENTSLPCSVGCAYFALGVWEEGTRKERTSGRCQQRGPLAVTCLSILAQSASPKRAAPGVFPGTFGSSQLHDIPVSLLVSPVPFLNYARLWARWLGTWLVPARGHLPAATATKSHPSVPTTNLLGPWHTETSFLGQGKVKVLEAAGQDPDVWT